MPLKLSESLEEPHLNLTPMIDIVFLLVIFFMVGTQFAAEEREIEIQLPTVSAAPPLTALPDELVVNIRKDGSISVNGDSRTLEELQQLLVEARDNYAEQTVVIRGAAEGPYQNVMNVLAICHRAQIKHISLANRLTREDE